MLLHGQKLVTLKVVRDTPQSERDNKISFMRIKLFWGS